MHIHIPFHNNISLTGTPVFSSINSHGAELSWHDDIESLAYLLIYFLQGLLPWLGINSLDMVLQLKKEISIHDLCSGLPTGFKLILKHAHALTFTQKPDCNLLQSYIHAMLPDDATATFDWQPSCLSSPTTLVVVTPKRNVPSCKQITPAMPVGFAEKKVCIFHFQVFNGPLQCWQLMYIPRLRPWEIKTVVASSQPSWRYCIWFVLDIFLSCPCSSKFEYACLLYSLGAVNLKLVLTSSNWFQVKRICVWLQTVNNCKQRFVLVP